LAAPKQIIDPPDLHSLSAHDMLEEARHSLIITSTAPCSTRMPKGWLSTSPKELHDAAKEAAVLLYMS
jgi:hypothetical protein